MKQLFLCGFQVSGCTIVNTYLSGLYHTAVMDTTIILYFYCIAGSDGLAVIYKQICQSVSGIYCQPEFILLTP